MSSSPTISLRRIITIANRRCHIQPRFMDTRSTAGRRRLTCAGTGPAELLNQTSSPAVSLSLTQVHGRLSVPSSETGSSSPRPEPGPAVSWNSGLTGRGTESQKHGPVLGWLPGRTEGSAGVPDSARQDLKLHGDHRGG